MKFRGLDADGDWMSGQGLGSYAQNAAAVALDIATAIRSIYGNCVFAPQDGVDWPHRLDKNQQANLVAELTTTINQRLGVVKVNYLNAVTDPKTRNCQVSGSAQTIFAQDFRFSVAALAGVPPSA